MNGRVLKVKKTTLLALSFILCSTLFLGFSLFLGLYYKRYNDWFFVFCFCVGLHFIFRAWLISVDSSCYLGFSMLLIGLMYFYVYWLDISKLFPSFILLSLAFASFFTYTCYGQPFQFTLFLSLLFVSFATAFYILNVISIGIFLAFIFLSVLLLVCRYFML